MCTSKPQLGLSLIELIVFIVIVSAAVAGVLGVFAMTSRGSADPMVQKQALAIAEAVMEEVQLMPFTYCDPDDPQAGSALSGAVGATGCTAAAAVENIGAETTAPYGPETRADAVTPFDNVNDYNNFAMGPGISSLGSLTNITGLDAYTASVTVGGQALGAGATTVPAVASLLITVTVTGPGNTTVTLHGYRTRYAPNALP
jgi:MSHA pilin protein MshD